MKESDGKYCPACGQRMAVKRLTIREGLYDFSSRVYGFESIFPRTLRDITFRPGIAARRFIEGNRAAYYAPFGYYFLMLTLTLLVASLLGIDFNEAMINRGRELVATEPAPRAIEAQKRFQALVLDNFKLFSFALVIFEALWLRMMFRRSGYNFVEHSVMPFYVLGHFYWLTILDFIIVKFFGVNINQYLIVTVSFLFVGYAAMNLYTYQSKVKAFLKGIVSYGLAFITFAILISIVTVLYVLLDPEMAEMIRPRKGP